MFRTEQFYPKALTSEWWTLESRLWDLLLRVYQYRMAHPNITHSLEETQVILRWSMDTATPPSDTEYIQSTRWLVTREEIKMRKLTGGRGFTEAIVTELDPDAPLRLGKSLMAEDEETDRTLLRQVFQYLRVGDLRSAQRVCHDSNNQWRAASLAGYSIDTGQLNGNWRRMCFQIARQPLVERFERAVYGVVCGDLDSVVPVCNSWEDQLWAHFNAIYIWELEEVVSLLGGCLI
jgi:nuclear pore complex protein Nup107